MEKVKIYAVTFLSYTNAMKDTVSDWDGVGQPTAGDVRYLDVGNRAFLVRESDLPYFQQFGHGFSEIHFVGYLGLPDTLVGSKDANTRVTELILTTKDYQFLVDYFKNHPYVFDHSDPDTSHDRLITTDHTYPNTFTSRTTGMPHVDQSITVSMSETTAQN